MGAAQGVFSLRRECLGGAHRGAAGLAGKRPRRWVPGRLAHRPRFMEARLCLAISFPHTCTRMCVGSLDSPAWLQPFLLNRIA